MRVEKSVLVPLGADETFALLTEPDRLRRWQAVTARVVLKAGGNYRWTILPGHTAAGSFTEVDPGRRLVFSWGWEGDPEVPPGASTVTITLQPAAGGTLLRLVHDRLTGPQAARHEQGWSHYLDRLVAAAGSGDAGPDDWGALPADPDPRWVAEAALAVCQRVLRGIPEGGHALPTLCPGFDIAALTDHLIGSVTMLGAAAGGSAADPRGTSLESRLAAVAQAALEAWRARGLDGTVQAGQREMPAAIPPRILSIEFLVHAWDFAQASGQQLVVADQLSAHVLEMASAIITPDVRSGGNFADPVQPGPDANALDRLVAFTGRAEQSVPN